MHNKPKYVNENELIQTHTRLDNSIAYGIQEL